MMPPTLLRESLSFALVEPMPPLEALAFFRSLVPMLGIDDPIRWWTDLRRRAFTLARATNDEMLSRIQNIVVQRLQTGERISAAPEEIETTLAALGAADVPAGYGETALRTNILDSFNQGLQNEVDQVKSTFPAWKYSAVVDSRSRPWHAERNGRLYSSDVPFNAVRGTSAKDICNCRCVMIPLDRWTVDELLAKGAKIEDWPD